MPVAPAPPIRRRSRSRVRARSEVRSGPRPRRAAWRQWLVEAERGLTAAFRSDSIFFVHLFVGSLALAAAWLLGLTATGWAVLTLALTVTLVAELFHQVLKGLIAAAGPSAAQSGRLAVAAVAAATFGSGTTIALLFAERLWTLFAG